MNGVIVAYHNTERIFGFQYIPLLEMDERLFGPEAGLGDKLFDKCIGILEAVLPEAAACYPEQVFAIHVPFSFAFIHTNNPLDNPMHI